jgi:hypothetical protein
LTSEHEVQDSKTKGFGTLSNRVIAGTTILYGVGGFFSWNVPYEGMSARFKIENPCQQKKAFCINCHSEFIMVRPAIKEVIVTKHFARDLKDKEADSLVKDILDCSNLEFIELHKFEENIDGNLIFRAKKGQTHFVYFVDKKMRIIFLRAFKNFTEYKKFLDDRKGMKRIIEEALNLA